MLLPLYWELPGGKLQENESEEQCIYRELMEELNIRIEIVNKLESNTHKYKNITINLIPYIINYVEGDIKLLEHNTIKWLHINELKLLEWAPADLAILEQILESNYI